MDSHDKKSNNTKPKVILDNDWGVAGFIPYLMALDAGWEVLGLVSDTANSWALQCGLHALATLEVGNLSCIPVHKGADYPLLNTPELFQTVRKSRAMALVFFFFFPQKIIFLTSY